MSQPSPLERAIKALDDSLVVIPWLLRQRNDAFEGRPVGGAEHAKAMAEQTVKDITAALDALREPEEEG